MNTKLKIKYPRYFISEFFTETSYYKANSEIDIRRYIKPGCSLLLKNGVRSHVYRNIAHLEKTPHLKEVLEQEIVLYLAAL